MVSTKLKKNNKENNFCAWPSFKADEMAVNLKNYSKKLKPIHKNVLSKCT
jgi:hypothetical protein